MLERKSSPLRFHADQEDKAAFCLDSERSRRLERPKISEVRGR
jgi:hypothetical protein